ncbi:hypothetical protein [uncultured Fibrobacter sp.]|uniref:hypothetical protein n=1 Tax=uncultured Fibrobacter sp. TaxID=261512 RepID=UPI0025F6AD92|nr:hypothetical protein [uncultured Fibrobacter sp.]
MPLLIYEKIFMSITMWNFVAEFFYWHNDLKDWSVFDKTVCGIALTDSDGNVIYGKNPSVSEFQSYDAPREGSVKVGL